MAYRIDKETNELVIDGWEKGVFPSPYAGAASIKNLNTTYYPGVAYVNYKRKECSRSGSDWYAGTHSTNVSNNQGWIFTAPVTPPVMGNPVSKAVSPAGLIYIQDNNGLIWKQTSANSSTFAELESGSGRLGAGNAGIAYWNNYLVVFGDELIEFCGDGIGDSGVISSNWNVHSFTSGAAQNSAEVSTDYSHFANNVYFATPPASPDTLPRFQVNDPVTFSTTGTLPAPLSSSTTYYILTLGLNYVTISTSVGGTAVTLTTNGSGTHTMTDANNPLPIGNCTDILISGSTPVSGETSATITSYTNPKGVSITSGTWQEASGTYSIKMGDGTELLGVFTNGSGTINFLQPLVYISASASTNWSVNLLDPTVTNYRPYVSRVDGNLYFANGRYVGRILAQNDNIEFNPYLPIAYTVSAVVTALLMPSDTVTDMVDLSSRLIVTGQKDIYTWDYVSATTTAPIPVNEPIKRIINILNNIYILAGQKGNIYVSNGYSAQVYLKMPDIISGVIDPVWTWGDMIFHRSKLFVQALAQSVSGSNILAGIFSIAVSPSLTSGDSPSVVLESQNSFGLAPASGSTGDGLLIDNEPSSDGRDSYYSAWSNGANNGGIDYNDTACWQNYEPEIETEIIPMGSILNKKTLGRLQFKLDRPMVSGDYVKLYWRGSLSDSYTLVGTTSTAQLSEDFTSNIAHTQWLQFKVAFKCASSGSSRIPLREIRLQIT